MKLQGTAHSDQVRMIYGVDNVYAGKGDDTVFLFNALNSIVRGGEGFDTFEFRIFDDQTYSVTKVGDMTTVIIDDAGYHQEIILKDFEKIVIHELEI